MNQPYRLFLNAEGTVCVRLWPDGSVEVATRNHPSDVWSPPQTLKEGEPS